MPSILELRQKEYVIRLAALSSAQKQILTLRSHPLTPPLHIVYVLNHVGVCGGVKVILEHANHLMMLGAKVTLISHFAKPDWFSCQADYIQIPFETELTLGIPPCHLIIATYWDHIQACIDRHIAPVIYFEQGDYHLFDRNSIDAASLHFIDVQFSLPPFIITVSHHVSELIKTIWNRESSVFSNAVDTSTFNLNLPPYRHPKPYILMIGSDESSFKGLPEILTAYSEVKKYFPYLDLIWVSPTPLSKTYDIPSKIIVNPSQLFLASLYRGASLFISASHYESFSLPVLEAMSCGCPVITTDNTGVRDYARDYINCLYTPINDPYKLAQTMYQLLNSPALIYHLIEQGLLTAQNFSWQKTIPSLFAFYKEVAQYQDILSPT